MGKPVYGQRKISPTWHDFQNSLCFSKWFTHLCIPLNHFYKHGFYWYQPLLLSFKLFVNSLSSDCPLIRFYWVLKWSIANKMCREEKWSDDSCLFPYFWKANYCVLFRFGRPAVEEILLNLLLFPEKKQANIFLQCFEYEPFIWDLVYLEALIQSTTVYFLISRNIDTSVFLRFYQIV